MNCPLLLPPLLLTVSRYLTNSNLPTAYGNMSPNPSHQILGSSSISYAIHAQDPYAIPAYVKGGDGRPQMRFDPYTGEPYKFDPFTGERVVPENSYENAYRLMKKLFVMLYEMMSVLGNAVYVSL
ncbi:hypothetical protein HanRHA438_Chr16g0738081 [Helianthus annuus]|nr:hypothetical protein HanLR1_Chr16g0602581 [Helianthus annuus]KAJ0643301.1 hypothetical protein HanOQP8_Chr16g0599091 [Helianthus annuus]KAJ0833930.1 hypothetical protein HanRHA438_Chr16g0738081 [Helianthus annuus]